MAGFADVDEMNAHGTVRMGMRVVDGLAVENEG